MSGVYRGESDSLKHCRTCGNAYATSYPAETCPNCRQPLHPGNFPARVSITIGRGGFYPADVIGVEPKHKRATLRYRTVAGVVITIVRKLASLVHF